MLPSRLVNPDLLRAQLLAWYDASARDLPWRVRPADRARGLRADPYRVWLSGIMLQQTTVPHATPYFLAFTTRWPAVSALAAAPEADVMAAWAGLGYYARARNLHACAKAVVADYGSAFPDDVARLRDLPGIGDYTAAAIATFAYGRRHVVLDTNVRRVLTRAATGTEFPAPAVTKAERGLATDLLPEDEPTAATWSVAVMELGALVCTAANPRCASCPVADLCAWRTAGHPAYDGPPRKVQTWAGTDRQCRGRLLGVLRDTHGVVAHGRLAAAWADEAQRERALAGLLADGLVVAGPGGYTLPD